MKKEKGGKIKINQKEGFVALFLNPKVYPLDVIYSAAYVFLDRAYILLCGDPKKRVVVDLKPKNNYDLKKLGREFNNELLNYAFYKKQSEKTKNIRESIIQRALLTNDPSLAEESLDTDDDLDYLEDPEGIAIPWEEKYGKKSKKKK